MAYDNTNRGTIAKNTRKSKDTDADIAGQLNVNGQEFWINGWLKKNSKDGSSFYSLAVKEKQAKQEKPAPKPDSRRLEERGWPDEDDSTIPF